MTRRTALVISASLTVAISGMVPVFLTGTMAVQMREDFALSPTMLGFTTTAFFAAAAIGSLVVGRRVDRWGWRRSMLVATLAQTGIVAAIALIANSAAVLVVGLAMAGFTHAVAMPAGNVAIVDHVPTNRRALVFGIRQSAIPAAILLAGLAVPAVALTLGWRWAYVGALAGPAITLLALLVGDEDRSAPSPAVQRPRGSGTWSPGLAAMVAASLLGAAVVNGSGSFFVSAAVDMGLSESAAGVLLAAGSVTAIGMRVIIGLAVDRAGNSGFVPMAVLLSLGAVGLFMIATGSTGIVLAGTPLMFGAGTGWAGLLHFILTSQHPDDPAAASSTALAFGYLGGAAGPTGFGLVAEGAGYGLAWSLLAVAAVAAAMLCLLSQRLFRVDAPSPAIP